ncbi:MAG TPA: Ig-like domain repeat protein [Terriglobales bacterium]|nr:Ig-like domain repeat protein [Terriglobales bacterium]
MKPIRIAALIALQVSLMLTLASLGYSQVQHPRITQAIDNNTVIRIANSQHPLATRANDRGRVDPNLPMERMLLVLKPGPEQQTAMERMLNDLHNPESPSYRQWLTPEKFGEAFGPADADVSQITSWLQQQGFRVNAVGRGKQFIEFSGTARQVENAFRTEMHHYSVHGEQHVANAGDISLPSALSPVVAGVLSLHDFRKKPAHSNSYRVHRDATTGRLVPDFTLSNQNGSAHFTAPGDFARIYNTQTLLNQNINGSGVSIAVVGRTNIQLSDVQTFRKIFGLPANDPIFIFNGGDPGVVPGEEDEADLDVEWSGAIAPRATIKFVVSPSTFSADGIDLSMNYVIDNVVAPIMSASFSACEAALGPTGNAFFHNLYEQAAAEGITVVVSTGDDGPAGCDSQISLGPVKLANVSGLASTPFNLAVGGTQFAENGLDGIFWNANNRPNLSSAAGYIPETVWNESCDPTIDPNKCFGTKLFFIVAGSGGPSSCVLSTIVNFQFVCQAGYPKPSWQAGVGVPNDGVRDLPDLALNAGGAHDGSLFCIEGSCQTTQSNGQTILLNAGVIGGTSVSAPSMAGIMALIEQKNGTFQGLANFTFYKLAAKDKLANCNSTNLINPAQVDTCFFRDTTQGSNAVPGLPGYPATSGYDMSTGLGSVNAARVAAGWNVVTKLPSVTRFASGTITGTHGSPVPINVAVSPQSGTGMPSGDIDLITSKSGSVFAGTLANGTLATKVADLPGGTYTATAHYSGDAMFKSSASAPVTVNIAPETSDINMQGFEVNFAGITRPLSSPVFYGEPVGFDIQVFGLSHQGAATGTLTMRDGKTVLGTFPMAATGHAFIEVDGLPESTGMTVGKHTYTVSYSGDNSFKPFTSAPISANVIRRPVQTDLAPLQTTVTKGAPVQLVLIVRGDAVTAFPIGVQQPTGTVRVIDNGKTITGPIPLVFGGPAGPQPQAIFTTSSFSVGIHALSVSYSGDKNYSPSDGSPGVTAVQRPVTVVAAQTKIPQITLQQNPATVSLGQTANYVVTVRPPVAGGPMPTGTASIVSPINNVLDGPRPLVNGNASFIVSFAGAATFQITASYSGDANYAPFSSPIITTQVNRGTPTLKLTAASSIVSANSQTSLTATVIGAPNDPIISLEGSPTGTVQFFDSVNGGAAQPLAFPEPLTLANGGNSIFTLPIMLPPGLNVITFQYSGNRNWLPEASKPITVTVK